jgi:uncharacterized protein YfdQ (DUF2303 family)
MSSSLDGAAVEAVAELARGAATAEQLEPGRIYLQPQSDGSVRLLDLTGDQYLDQPKRKTGTYKVADVPSFVAYWSKHSDTNSEIFGVRSTTQIEGVLNAHATDQPGWADHRVVLDLQYTDQLKAWQSIDGRLLRQVGFAEFIEQWRSTIRTPDSATMLELAQTFHATTKVEFKSGTVLASGQRQLQYVEDTRATAGRKGELQIPAELELGIPVFRGAEVADRFRARLRYRIDGGELQLGVQLTLPGEVIDAAFNEMCSQIAEQCETGVYRSH